jgi:hypothetical protein
LGWLETLIDELFITFSTPDVHLAILQAFVVGTLCLILGIWVSRLVGLLDGDAPAGETLAVGLATGLLVGAALWAALASGGRSSFAPSALGFVLSVVIAIIRPSSTTTLPSAETNGATAKQAIRWAPHKGVLIAVALAAATVAAAGVLYGSTLVLSPRDSVQPIEFMDTAYYSVLSLDLARTGTETVYSPSGFVDLAGLPAQTWYHWGEVWLTSAVMETLGTEALVARHWVVLPLLLAAAAMLTGTMVRRMVPTSSRAAYFFGCGVSLFLAPIPLTPGPFFSTWAVGLAFGITLYGLAAVGVLLGMHSIIVTSSRPPTWARAVFVGSIFAAVLASHLVIAALGLLGIGAVWLYGALRDVRETGRLRAVSPSWRRTIICASLVVTGTVIWGLVTRHGVGGSATSANVAAFNPTWSQSVFSVAVGAGAFLAIPVAWFIVRRDDPAQAGLYMATTFVVGTGAVFWGARLADYNTFHVFFGAIAAFATPAAAVAVWSLYVRLKAAGHRAIAFAVVLACVAQVELGAGLTILKLQSHGPHYASPLPIAFLDAIRDLPSGAKVAYSCQPAEEVAIWDARLLGITAHTGRHVVPMCFQSDTLGDTTGMEPTPSAPSPLFRFAPQRSLYPELSSTPSAGSITTFLDAHRIDYIYADGSHPNRLVPNARLVAEAGEFRLLEVPGHD